eukprot:CFRG5035T1
MDQRRFTRQRKANGDHDAIFDHLYPHKQKVLQEKVQIKDNSPIMRTRKRRTQNIRAEKYVVKIPTSARKSKKRSAEDIAKKKEENRRKKTRIIDSNEDGKHDYDDGHYRHKCGERLNDKYVIKKMLGKGTFATVLECTNIQTKQSMAVKVIKNVTKYRDAAFLEIKALRELHECDAQKLEHVIHMVETFEHRKHICMVFDLLGPSLYDVLSGRSFQPMSLKIVREISIQLLLAVDYMHSLEFVHTDLKPENILLVKSYPVTVTCTKNNQQDTISDYDLVGSRIRVIDVGSVARSDRLRYRVVSTRHYRAPEVILEMGWGKPCDMWSIGCIFIELYTGKCLFQTHENLEHLAMIEKIVAPLTKDIICRSGNIGKQFFDNGKLNWPAGCSNDESFAFVDKQCKPLESFRRDVNCEEEQEFMDFVRKLLCLNPDKRMTANMALRHNFTRGEVSERIAELRSGC